MNPYLQFAREMSAAVTKARQNPLGGFQPLPRKSLAADAPVALFFSPHPDDECISGGVALRLLRQAGMRVMNVAVTQGSKKERQQERLNELKGACDYLGFELIQTCPGGLEKVNPRTREQDKAHWAKSVQVIADILKRYRPRVVMCPHDRDWNSTHVGTHYLVVDALAAMPADYECFLVETEFWGQMVDPNLMLEFSAEELADMIAALTFHVGEVARNPYHLSLPAWMMDNVRRGGEIVGGQGGAAPDYMYAAIYRLRKWSNGRLTRTFEGGKLLPSEENVGALFP